MFKKQLIIVLIIVASITTYIGIKLVEISNSDKNFAKYATPVVPPDNMKPLRLIRTNVEGTYMVLTTDHTLLLYSINGNLLDSYDNNKNKNPALFRLTYNETLEKIIYIISDSYDPYPYTQSQILGIRVNMNKIEIEAQKTNQLFKYLKKEENTSNTNVSIKNHCLSVDIEYGSCLYNYITITANNNTMYLWNKKLEHSLKIYDKTLILISNWSNQKANIEDTYEANLYLLDTELRQQHTR